MAKRSVTYMCSVCGAQHARWVGRCSDCGEWNCVEAETFVEPGTHARPSFRLGAAPKSITDAVGEPPERLSSGMAECDRVLGGGIVPGSLILVGGSPGIGKSTIMLQVARHLADSHGVVLYVSGEESFEQTRLRARRVGAFSDRLLILTETSVDAVQDQLESNRYSLVVIDSIQSVYSSKVASIPGSVTQVRECATEFLRLAKGLDVPICIVGHVTKQGSIAGPKMLEHLVDTVLYFEGEGEQALRILRARKNRFGSTNEIGVFEMTDSGLLEVLNPSAIFLDERPEGVSGSVVIPSIEGTRPLLVEVQALVSKTVLASPRRTVTGVNPNRVSLLLAVLEKRAGLHLSDKDVFVNVAGGVRLEEPATDVAVALAVASSLLEAPVAGSTVAFGECGLAGEIRAVNMSRQRVAEASKFGFTQCILPRSCVDDIEQPGLELLPVSGIAQALETALEK